MKRLFFILAAVVMTASVWAEDLVSSDNNVASGQQERIIVVPPKRADINFQLYPTQNTYIFLLLDTRNGRIWMEQWGIDSKDRIEVVLSTQKQGWGDGEIPGRFELYPTSNVYNFIMVDHVYGTTWQVQWSTDPKKRMVVRIN